MYLYVIFQKLNKNNSSDFCLKFLKDLKRFVKIPIDRWTPRRSSCILRVRGTVKVPSRTHLYSPV